MKSYSRTVNNIAGYDCFMQCNASGEVIGEKVLVSKGACRSAEQGLKVENLRDPQFEQHEHTGRSISFSLNPGQCMHVQGGNGCGKTVMLKRVCQLLSYSGAIAWQGRRVAADDAHFFTTYRILAMI